MIPIKLQLRNFLCYRDDVPPLSFEDFHVVCLSGDNGNGKSALLDAITWALWGKARVDDRELIHYGRTEMEVEFEFELGQDRYRVIRKRSLKATGKGVRTQLLLDFQIFSDGQYRSISGNKVEETSHKIVDTLRMNYHTFVNSAFLRQGRADEFTSKTPAERKEVLGDILGLRDYDDLADRAKEQAKRCEKEQLELVASIKEIDKELDRKPEYEAQLAAIQSEMKLLENEIAGLEEESARLKARKEELDIKAHQLADLRGRIDEARREIEEMQGQIDQHQQRIEEYEEVLAERADIEAGYARLVDARGTNDALNEKMSQLMGLKEREGLLERAIAGARSALVADQKGILGTVEILEKRSSQASSIERQLYALREQVDSLGDLDGRRDEKVKLVESCRSQIQILKMTNAQLRQDMSDVKEKLELVSRAGASCPLCDSDLGPTGRDRLIASFQAEGRRMGDVFRDNSKQIEKLECDIQAAQGEIAKIERAVKDREALQRQVAMLEKGLADAREAEEQLAEAREQLDAVRGKIEREAYAEAERNEIADVRARMLALGYDEQVHRNVRDAVASLKRYENLKQRLDAASDRVGEERAALERTRTILSRWQTNLDRDSEQRQLLENELRALPEVGQKLANAERRLAELLDDQANVRLRLGRAQQMLNHCRYLEGERARKIVAQAKVAEEEALYKELHVAFGKNGVQAMIIDNAIPEIEDEANALLARMTDGRLHVTLETQTEQQDGGLKETLQIKVGDELGLRGYDTYSGGEAFRINFALRIALSKLLARRAGAPLQTLVIDEGFGTLDASGRDSLVEAINSVSDDFEKIIVITHIQELKDAFPARIDVVKDADGSKVIVVS